MRLAPRILAAKGVLGGNLPEKKFRGKPHLPTMFQYPSIRVCGGFGADMTYIYIYTYLFDIFLICK